MHKKFIQFFILLAGLAFAMFIFAQSDNVIRSPDQQIPAALRSQLDSLHKADDLTGWLYAYREYVYEDPANRIAILTEAQANVWRDSKTDAEREEWFNCLATRGYYLLYNGNILRSIDAYEKAYQFYFDKPLPGVDVLEYVLKPLGNNYTRLGDYDRAFFIQEKSLALAEEKEDTQIASICHNLATTAIWKENLQLAKQYCIKGLQQVDKNTSLHGLLLSTLSEVFLKTGDRRSANTNCKAAIHILTARLSQTGDINVPYWLRGAWQGLGDIQKEENEPAAALSSYQKAIELIDIYYAGQRKREKAQLLVLTGRMLLQLQQPKKATEQFNVALSLMLPLFQPENMEDLPRGNDLYGENTLLDALQGKAACLRALNKKEKALDCFMLMYTVEKKLRREFFGSAAKQQQQKENKERAESAIETAFELWKASGKKEYADKLLLIAEMSKAQLLLDEMRNSLHFSRVKNNDTLLSREQEILKAISYYEKETLVKPAGQNADGNALAVKKELQFELALIQKQLKEKYPLQENLMQSAALPSIDGLLQNIDADTKLIEFFTGEKNIYRIEAEKAKVVQIHRIENAGAVLQQVNNFLNSYFLNGPDKMINDPQRYYYEAFAVNQYLLKGITIGEKQNCMIVPDGMLGYVPFDALVTDSVYVAAVGKWPFLAKKTNLYFCYSLQTKMQQLQIQHSSRSFVGFFISFDSSRSSIPAVRKEYEEIHAVMKGDYYNDEKATLAVFNKQLSGVNLLHISTHSFLQGIENTPVLQLADDRFFLFELYGKSFRPQLVVLSACRTGHGMLARGEGIISLARGFTATGAAGIVAGLWDMNDETTALLMGNFYQFLNKGQAPATALQHAKLQWIQQQNGSQVHQLPYFWAGMVYSGDNIPVEIKKRDAETAWLWIAIILVVAAIIFLLKKYQIQFR